MKQIHGRGRYGRTVSAFFHVFIISILNLYSIFQRKGQKQMKTEKFVMQTELVASEDGLHTYEVRRSWSDKGKKGLVLELYPTLSMGRSGEMDLSTMHLLNHIKDSYC